MRLLVVGGAGLVGGMIIPAFAQRHDVRVFDRNAPSEQGVEYVCGSVEDYTTLYQAASGADVLIYLAMNPKGSGKSPETAGLAFDVNVKGLYLALWAASARGVEHAVLASSLSVYKSRDRYPGEDAQPDAQTTYGFTKQLGEEVGRHAVAARQMSVNALRLCHPIPDAEWPPAGDDQVAVVSTRSSDVAAAFEAALHVRDGFQAITISGDDTERYVPLGKAKRILGWSPTPARRDAGQ